jgi:hypothetical protein
MSATSSTAYWQKVKMSLKGFAIRKRKKREQEQTRDAVVKSSTSLQSREAGNEVEVSIPNMYGNEG